MRYIGVGSNELLVNQPDFTNGHRVLLLGYVWCIDHAWGKKSNSQYMKFRSTSDTCAVFGWSISTCTLYFLDSWLSLKCIGKVYDMSW